jgi:predicted enzyme related to lactoylglutathione lyase
LALDRETPTFGSLLLSSPDPQRLERWYSQFVSFGNVPALFDKRDDVPGPNAEPGRYILNFHSSDARTAAAAFDAAGAEWLSPLEERDNGMFFGTVIDPDGNYVQIIQMSDEMYRQTPPDGPFASCAVRDLDQAVDFYRNVLGLRVVEQPMGPGIASVMFSTNSMFTLYPKPDHQPAVFTVMNFPVDDLNAEIDRLASAGVTFERYEGMEQDARGIAPGEKNGGPDIAWFTDPSGNILSVMQR